MKRWIPISEGLPNGNEHVLVFRNNGSVSVELGYTVSAAKWIAAWMPLPDPYEPPKPPEPREWKMVYAIQYRNGKEFVTDSLKGDHITVCEVLPEPTAEAEPTEPERIERHMNVYPHVYSGFAFGSSDSADSVAETGRIRRARLVELFPGEPTIDEAKAWVAKQLDRAVMASPRWWAFTAMRSFLNGEGKVSDE